MSILGNDLLLGSGDEGYNLTRSLRFRASASAYLNRTPASATNRKTWTWSGWVKRGALGTSQGLFARSNSSGTSHTGFLFESDNTLRFFSDANGAYTVLDIKTSQVFRDVSSWYHVVVVLDTTQATNTNRVKIYVNGAQVTNFATTNYPNQNDEYQINTANPHGVGNYFEFSGGWYLDGYLAEVNFIDGQALTPSSFGSTNALTGVWQPAAYTGTYGTNGFYLPFTDNSALTTASNVGLGKDFSGNANYWATNNISITAGVTYDSMTDVPTLTSATAANFAVLNPLDRANSSLVTSNANMVCTNTGGAGNAQIRATIALPSTGKFYWETKNTGSANNFNMGLTTTTASLSTEGAGDVFYNENGVIGNNGTNTSGYSTLALNDVVGVAVDIDANKIYWYKNNTLVNSGGTTINISAPFAPMFGFYTTNNAQSINFGQQPFTYTPPTGFVALNTYNLPTSTIVKGNTVMDANIFTATGGTGSVAVGFQPDFTWIKDRQSTIDHFLHDSVRGYGNYLSSNTTAAAASGGGVTAATSTGFNYSIGNTNNWVSWNWQAGQGTNTTNTNGTITSTVSVNASAGFSVVTATSPASGNAFTLGHGLGVAPAFIISKSRSGTGNWSNYHVSTGAGGYLLFTTAAYTANTDTWNNTAPTSSLISTTTNWWGNSANLVFYCWTPIAGYSAFGSYTGNGSANGPFTYTGFRPRWVLIKASSTTSQWVLWDTARNTYNVTNSILYPNLSAAETLFAIDILSNGFKFRESGGAGNDSGVTYIYAAFAENPFKNALAR